MERPRHLVELTPKFLANRGQIFDLVRSAPAEQPLADRHDLGSGSRPRPVRRPPPVPRSVNRDVVLALRDIAMRINFIHAQMSTGSKTWSTPCASPMARRCAPPRSSNASITDDPAAARCRSGARSRSAEFFAPIKTRQSRSQLPSVAPHAGVSGVPHLKRRRARNLASHARGAHPKLNARRATRPP